MPKVTLTINGGENYETDHPLITIGRTADNSVALPDDSNISRYHARIEQREDGFWLIDQGSSNGSAVNGNDVEGEMLLENGDTITLGGTSNILFETDEVEEEEEEATSASGSSGGLGAAGTNEAEKAKGSSGMMLLAGTVLGVALLSAAVAGVVYWKYSGTKCEATARITNPESGDTIKKETQVDVEVTNSQCVQEVVFLLNGQKVASSASEPFSATIDPKQHGDLADGGTHRLTVVMIDAKGEQIVQSNNGIFLAFETIQTPTPTPEATQTPVVKPGGKPAPGGKTGSVIETKTMGEKLLKQFSGGSVYKFDQQFWLEVNKKLPEYMVEGYSERADKYDELINISHSYEQNVDAPFAYILAMSRSKFNPVKQGSEEGLWRMSNEFIVNNGYNLVCGTETLGDASQNCAAKASALYQKAIYVVGFDRDFIYSVAAFGMSPQEAAAWKATLPADRRDFWNIIKSPKQREEIIRFFAAGIVAENPQKFNLKKDKPLSELYKITMGG
jgi:pSer/pThr/pTyr-binding forkhead associated (FHA) protein